MWEKEKLLVASNFFFSHNVFHRYVSLMHQNEALCGNGLRNRDPDGRVYNRAVLDISVVLWETILAISDSIETSSPIETETIGVVSLSTTEITEMIRFQKTDPQGGHTLSSEIQRSFGMRKTDGLQMFRLSPCRMTWVDTFCRCIKPPFSHSIAHSSYFES